MTKARLADEWLSTALSPARRGVDVGRASAAVEGEHADDEAEIVEEAVVRELVDAHREEQAGDQREQRDVAVHEAEQQPGQRRAARGRRLVRTGGENRSENQDRSQRTPPHPLLLLLQAFAATLLDSSPRLRASDTNSLGIMTMVMVFCSAPTSVIICMRRSSSAEGFRMMTSAASRSCWAAAISASALMIRARFSRRASASCAMARCIDSGISTFFICTRSTLTPHGSVARSIAVCIRPEISSWDFRISSSECSPSTARNVVSDTCSTAFATARTSITARLGSMMRYQTTVLTLTGTLSRVIASCCSTAVVT